MKIINPILIATLFIAAISAAGVGLGMHYLAAVPIALAIPVLIVAGLKDAPERAESLLHFGAITFLASSLLWPKYAAFFLPGLPLINPQRIANALILLIIISILITHKHIQDEYKASLQHNKPFWIFAFLFVGFRFISVTTSSDFGSSAYRYIQELFTHVIFLILGLHFGSNEKRLRDFTKTIFISLILLSILGIVEGILKKNIFSYFIKPANEYMAWALSDKSREGSYRVKSTFDHPLTFAEFIAIGTSISLCFAFNISSKTRKFLALAAIGFFSLTSTILSGSRSGYLALALSFSILIVAPLIFTVIHKKMTLKKATTWSFLIIVVLAVISGLAGRVYDYTLGKHAFSASDSARVVMVTRALKLTKQSPIYGQGVGLGAEKVGVKIDPMATQYTIDSFYVSILVESGVIAIFSFIGMLSCAAYSAWRKAAKNGDEDWFLWHAIATAIIALIIFKSILSLLDNNYLMYILLGVAVSRCAIPTKPKTTIK